MIRRVVSAVIAILLLGTGSAYAECNKPRQVCMRMLSCISDLRDNRKPDNERIYKGVSERNGSRIWEGADACQVDMGEKDGWDKDSGGCSPQEYLKLAELAIARSCDQLARTVTWYCGVPTGNGGYQMLGTLYPNGECTGETIPGNNCDCPLGNGKVYVDTD